MASPKGEFSMELRIISPFGVKSKSQKLINFQRLIGWTQAGRLLKVVIIKLLSCVVDQANHNVVYVGSHDYEMG